ncbi:glycosyltransferase family 4 protein [Fuscibacter oryzae]|uniref:Glycosyltransferase family 4 protein n=1 Tax=Fuscibacter oryzae TaxID=2803939 RepID=A0A8J7MVM3_9RHOB|nr:glycosyltransferase family 4 protein [Fuscibacter oryzae]MBL4928634.1 glycosyltransferase family 4 protein [Fuscibacter oryzae]
MTDPIRNAALWYAQDGYDPAAKGINGRRVAGESFLRGFLAHADVAEAVVLSKTEGELAAVCDLAARLRPGLALRHAPLLRPGSIAPVGTVYYPSPNFATEAWRRVTHGNTAWSLCGITHTTSTAAVMEGWLSLRTAPVGDWDAVICTSRAVHASVSYQLDLIDNHLAVHLRARLPPRPMLPVIPLGINTGDFVPDKAAGAGLRDRLGAGPGDVVFTTIARLTPHEKFDPLPVFTALAEAQRRLGGQRLHLVLCGVFRDDYSRKVFEDGARVMMPDVGFLILDGAQAADRKAALSGADAFLFLIDNIQETFGLAPIEAMAAGLPVLVSDWDGMKDTVTPDVGFRVTTRSLSSGHLAPEALRYQGGIDNYPQYCAATSALTEVDMGELVTRIMDLAQNPALRARMGQAGGCRARALYDWSQVVPQMQDLWAEQTARRKAATRALRYAPDALPIAPSPTALFAAWPTERAEFGQTLLLPVDRTGQPDLAAVLAVRNYQGLGRIFAAPDRIAAVLATIPATGATRAEVARAVGLNVAGTDRVLIWLLKYGFIRRG